MYQYNIGDIIKTKKPHPCGSNLWEITRVGADMKIKCTGCSHIVMIDRAKLDKSIKEIVKTSIKQE